MRLLIFEPFLAKVILNKNTQVSFVMIQFAHRSWLLLGPNQNYNCRIDSSLESSMFCLVTIAGHQPCADVSRWQPSFSAHCDWCLEWFTRSTSHLPCHCLSPVITTRFYRCCYPQVYSSLVEEVIPSLSDVLIVLVTCLLALLTRGGQIDV